MPETVTNIIDSLDQMEGRRAIGDMIAELQHRGTASFLILPPVLELSPFGSIPGVPSILAAMIALFAIQIVWGRPHLWVPRFIARREMPNGRVSEALSAARPWAIWIDKHLSGKRLHLLVEDPARRIAALLVIALCAVVPPLEVVPWASSLPMGAILCIGLALLFRNGVLMLFACGASVAAFFAVASMLL